MCKQRNADDVADQTRDSLSVILAQRNADIDKANKKAVLSQGNRAMPFVSV